MQEFIEVTKLALRDQVLAARRHLPLSVIGERARALADHLMEAPELRQAATVAAYVSVSSEPGTGPLLDRLHAAGKRVILPLLRPDNDLDWAAYDGPDGLRTARRGLLEPAGPPLGREALTTADAVLVPGIAVGQRRDPARSRRRVLRPGAGARARPGPSSACCSTPRRSWTACRATTTTGR